VSQQGGVAGSRMTRPIDDDFGKKWLFPAIGFTVAIPKHDTFFTLRAGRLTKHFYRTSDASWLSRYTSKSL
jgi:hypothetical protein